LSAAFSAASLRHCEREQVDRSSPLGTLPPIAILMHFSRLLLAMEIFVSRLAEIHQASLLLFQLKIIGYYKYFSFYVL